MVVLQGKVFIYHLFFDEVPLSDGAPIFVLQLRVLRLFLVAGDGPDVPGGGHLHPRPHHERHRGEEGLRRHGRLIISRIKHFRRHCRVRERAEAIGRTSSITNHDSYQPHVS